MSVLLLRLAGPMQSWGTQSRFLQRDTGLEPSKSGIVGLIGAAMGIERNDSRQIENLSKLRLAVRIDRPGSMKRDYHTALDVRKADGSIKRGQAVVSERYYLANAEFLVALEGNQELLEKIDDSLRNPVWPIFLGRKSFLPSKPVFVEGGVREGELLSVIESHPIDVAHGYETGPAQSIRFRIVYDSDKFGMGEPRQDVPISFTPREFGVRYVSWKFTDPPLAAVSENEVLV